LSRGETAPTGSAVGFRDWGAVGDAGEGYDAGTRGHGDVGRAGDGWEAKEWGGQWTMDNVTGAGGAQVFDADGFARDLLDHGGESFAFDQFRVGG